MAGQLFASLGTPGARMLSINETGVRDITDIVAFILYNPTLVQLQETVEKIKI